MIPEEDERHDDSGHQLEDASFNKERLQFVARRVVLKLAPKESIAALEEAIASVVSGVEGAQALRPPSLTGRLVVVVPEGMSVREAARSYASMDGVVYAEPDFVDTAQIVPNDPRYSMQWGPPLVGAEQAWDLETGAGNVVIGIVDSGISMTGAALDHDDLSDAGRITLGTDFVDGGTPRDLHGHGTHVAGIAGASTNNAAGVAGMNWHSPMYITRVFDANRTGTSADFADAVEEITDWALAHGLRAVINYSGGGPDNQTKRDACQYASDNGMLLIAAAGNDNGGPVIFPAAYSTTINGVVAVGSTEANDTVSGFSNVGPEVTVVAPGGNIQSTLPTYSVTGTSSLNYGAMSGTSMATPMVSGLAALMWSRHPGHTAAKVKQCLCDTAVKLGAGNFNNSWGFGRIDAEAALRCGDVIVIPPTKLNWWCRDTYLTRCPSDLWGCPENTRLSAVCRSLLIELCRPITQLDDCPVITRLGTGCDVDTRLRCPTELPVLCPITSQLDACPSTLRGCDFEPYDPGRPIEGLRPTEIRLRRIEAILGLGTNAAAAGEGRTGWFYVDDDGIIHEI